MTTSELELNPTAASLLGFLHDGPRTGYELLAIAQVRIGPFWSLTRSQVYKELGVMAGAGLVEPGDRGTREKRPYAITDAGRKAFREWASREPAGQTTRFPLLLLVALGANVPPDLLQEFLKRHRAYHAEQLAYFVGLREQLRAARPRDAWCEATVDFGIRYEEAALGWFDALPTKVRGRKPLA